MAHPQRKRGAHYIDRCGPVNTHCPNPGPGHVSATPGDATRKKQHRARIGLLLIRTGNGRRELEAPRNDGTTRIRRVWDLPLRLFHWLLVATLVGSWATQQLGTAWMAWHVRLGYLALGLVTFRLLWGFMGSRHARFTKFLTGPGKASEYARDLIAGRPKAFAGHSPLAG